MNWSHLLTIIFVVAKLAGVINWSWWLVLLPSLISFGLSWIILAFFFIIAALASSSRGTKWK